MYITPSIISPSSPPLPHLWQLFLPPSLSLSLSPLLSSSLNQSSAYLNSHSLHSKKPREKHEKNTPHSPPHCLSHQTNKSSPPLKTSLISSRLCSESTQAFVPVCLFSLSPHPLPPHPLSPLSHPNSSLTPPPSSPRKRPRPNRHL